MTGTAPCGFILRNAGSSRPPNAPPASMCRCSSSSSPTSHMTFWTLNELRRPQTHNGAPSGRGAWLRGVVPDILRSPVSATSAWLTFYTTAGSPGHTPERGCQANAVLLPVNAPSRPAGAGWRRSARSAVRRLVRADVLVPLDRKAAPGAKLLASPIPADMDHEAPGDGLDASRLPIGNLRCWPMPRPSPSCSCRSPLRGQRFSR